MFLLLASNVQAQNDTMYIMKDGNVINQYSMQKSDVDSIVFYFITPQLKKDLSEQVFFFRVSDRARTDDIQNHNLGL